MKVFWATLSVVALSFPPSADAILPPLKSHICMGAFRQLGLMAPGIRPSDRQYIYNSLQAFRQHKLGHTQVDGGDAEGFISSKSNTWRFGPKAAAQRVAGIEDFFRTSEGDDASRKRTVQAVSIVGKENIENFIKELRERTKQTKHSNELGLRMFMYFAHVNLTPFLAKAVSENDIRSWAEFAIGAYVFGLDHHVHRVAQADYRFFSQMGKALKEVTEKKDGAALISRNAQLLSSAKESMMGNLKDDEAFKVAGYQQEVLGDRYWSFLKSAIDLLGKAGGARPLKTEWAGLDLLFEKNAAGEPELHVIIRSSEKRPVFPKAATENPKAASPVLAPQPLPGLVPIPVRPSGR